LGGSGTLVAELRIPGIPSLQRFGIPHCHRTARLSCHRFAESALYFSETVSVKSQFAVGEACNQGGAVARIARTCKHLHRPLHSESTHFSLAIRAKCRAMVAPQYSSKPELNRVVRRCTNIHMKRFEDLSPSAPMAQ
jgi:hypothetical protein